MEKEQDIKELQKLAKDLIRDWDNHESYKKSLGIYEDAMEAVNAYEGNIWKDNKKGPFEKPTFNTIKYEIDGKKASINAKKFKLNFIVNNDQASTKKVSDFSDFILYELEYDEKIKLLTDDGLKKGTYVMYFYWDEESEGTLGQIKGALKCDIIDIEDIAVANPMQRDTQRQEWIIIRSVETIKNIRKLCDTLDNEEDKKKYIKVQEYTTIYKDNTNLKNTDNNENQTSTLYTKFFKKDGEVYFQYFTENICITKPRALNPLINQKIALEELEKIEEKDNDLEKKEKKEEVVDSPTNLVQDINQSNPDVVKYKANLYPIEIGSFVKRNKCIYGISDVKDSIINNRTQNRLIAANILYIIKNSVNTTFVKQGALGTQKLDPSTPGQVLTDFSPVGVQGVYQLPQQSVPTTALEMATRLFDYSTQLNRTKDLVSQNAISGDLSGVAMQQLVSEQNKPVEQYQSTLCNSMANHGKILEMFYKLFFRNTQFSRKITEDEKAKMTNNQESNQMFNDYGSYPEMVTEEFNGVDYLDTPFNVQVQVGESTRYSELMTMQIVMDFYKSGTYSNLTVDQKIQFFSLLDKNYFGKRDVVLRMLYAEKNGIIAQYQQQIQQYDQIVQQMQQQIQNQSVNMKAMYEEFASKTGIYNEEIGKSQNRVKELETMIENNQKVNKNE